ncbi:MAG: endolytic transglycosylase MltG [Bacteroidetes bacterium]|nr:MAG: endolytic transglycosylase MltG [Bacteroidota bacterium]
MSLYHSKYGSPRQKQKKGPLRKILIWLLVVLIVVAGGAAYYLYRVIFDPNTWTPEGKTVSITIPTASNFEDVKQILYQNGLIIHRKNFEWLAQKKKYPKMVMPGMYQIRNGMSSNELINLLRSGEQTPVNVTFNNIRDIYQLAGVIGKQIEADSASIANLLSDTTYIRAMGVKPATVTIIFIPDTYEFYWNTTAEGFIERMYKEYLKFWNGSRSNLAADMDLRVDEVVTMASIVEKETNKNDERAAIAGVYYNRLESGWRLQADPTLVYALGDFNITRVLNEHKKIDSPYNTYAHLGLPPGPICIPSIASIDAVLNYRKADYMFFCAKDDMSGYHVFAKSNRGHSQNAKKYREALNRMKIYK